MRKVLKLSKAEVGRLGATSIAPEHYLLAIIRKGDGRAIEALAKMDIDLEEVKLEIERMVPIGKGPTFGLFSPTAEAKRVIETSREIANSMKHGWVGPEHLLLALIREQGTIPAKSLREFEVDYAKTERAVIDVIEGTGSQTPETTNE